MKISAITTCVDYADHLVRSIDVWRDTLDEWLVVTRPSDMQTRALCEAHRVRCEWTFMFDKDGAAFNKAAAIDEHLPGLTDWILLIDADVQPPRDWRKALEGCEPGSIYGANRGERDTKCLGGFFHLWHASDPAWTANPTLGSWKSAGAYDAVHEERWPADRRVRLPLTLAHHGRRDKDWCGRGNAAGMRELLAARKGRDRGWEGERLG